MAVMPGMTMGVKSTGFDDSSRRYPIPNGSGLRVGARIGLLPFVDIGGEINGLNAVGGDVKAGFRSESVRLAANIGMGEGGVGGDGLNGYESRETKTRFGGLFLGVGGAYAAVKRITYDHVQERYESDNIAFRHTVSAFTFGYIGEGRHGARPIAEINVYNFPTETVYTIGMGIQFLLDFSE